MTNSEILRTREDLETQFGRAPSLAFVLGSGFSLFVDALNIEKRVATSSLAGCHASSVQGHKGEVLKAALAGKNQPAFMTVSGRLHGYEGHSPDAVVHLLRALRLWGVTHFVLTNAAGSTSLSYKPGDLVLIKDHINLTGKNPLTGKDLFGGPRFPDMSDAYSKAWRKATLKIAVKRKIKLKEGIYMGVNGPSFETAAEIRTFNKMGAHLVGMSTVWENIALHQMGGQVLGLSCVTNFGTGLTAKALSHNDVLETTKRAQRQMLAALTLIASEGAPAS